jgi:hypothetical protein
VVKNILSHEQIMFYLCFSSIKMTEWVESVMPVHFVPRTEACSSTLIRTIYHADSDEIRQKAAFAKTRYDGKPIDENGNVLKLHV